MKVILKEFEISPGYLSPCHRSTKDKKQIVVCYVWRRNKMEWVEVQEQQDGVPVRQGHLFAETKSEKSPRVRV